MSVFDLAEAHAEQQSMSARMVGPVFMATVAHADPIHSFRCDHCCPSLALLGDGLGVVVTLQHEQVAHLKPPWQVGPVLWAWET